MDLHAIIKAKRHDTWLLVVTDGLTWKSHFSDLNKIVDRQNQGEDRAHLHDDDGSLSTHIGHQRGSLIWMAGMGDILIKSRYPRVTVQSQTAKLSVY